MPEPIDGLRLRLQTELKLTLAVKVIPKSARSEFAGYLSNGTLKVKIAAVPENGKANAELCRFLAEALDVPQRSVQILQGQASALKRVRIERA